MVNRNQVGGANHTPASNVKRTFRPRTTLPGSVAELRKVATRNRIGISDSNTCATYGLGGVAVWNSTKGHDIIEGDLLWTARRPHENNIMTAISLPSVNEWSRMRFTAAQKLVSEALRIGVGLSCGITDAQLREMMRLPTDTWKDLGYLMEKVNAGNEEAVLVNELTLDAWVSTWNCYGVALGQQGQAPRMLATTVAREGVIQEVANIWGKTATPNKKLYLVLKRADDGPYYWCPMCGYELPCLDELRYTDVTGHTRYAPCLEVGHVLWWNNGAKIEWNFEVDAGLVPKPGSAYTRSSADFKIYFGPPRGSKHQVCF